MLVRLDEFSHLADSVSGLKMFVIFRKLSVKRCSFVCVIYSQNIVSSEAHD